MLSSVEAGAAPNAPRPGWTKFLLARPNASAPAQLFSDVGAVTLQEYDQMTLGYVRHDALKALRSRAVAARLEVVDRDDFDTLQLPGGTIDTRRGMAGSFPGRALPQPPKDVVGSWVIQFIGPPLKSWMDAVTGTGATLVQYIPYNGFIAVGTDFQMSDVALLPFVQLVDVFHPFLKSVAAPTGNIDGVNVVAFLANGPFVKGAVERISALSDKPIASRKVGPYLEVAAHLSDPAISELTENPLVIALASFPELALSDERVAMSTTPNVVSLAGPPLQPQGYKRWLAEACEFCGTLNSDGFVIGLADSGIDGGRSTGTDPYPIPTGMGLHRLDLPETRIQYGKNFNTNGPFSDPIQISEKGYLHDVRGHGTMVAGVAAGDPPSGAETDAGGFNWGTGIAPSAGIAITEVLLPNAFFHGSLGDFMDILDYAPDARLHGAYIQNHSRNQYRYTPGSSLCDKVYDGKYSTVSYNFDAAVRHADGDSAGPITLTVSAGNRSQQGVSDDCPANTLLSIPPATAKNVIAVGGAENVRGSTEQWNCTGERADSFSNVASDSTHGTQIPGRYKPDLMAPASNVVSSRSYGTANPATALCTLGGTPPDLTDYYASEGTSFAAPVAAGAAVLASRVFAEATKPNCRATYCDAGAATPALIKAMLIASARSMRGGEDRSVAGPWAANHNYTNGSLVRPTIANGRYYRSSTSLSSIGASSGPTEPAFWPMTVGGTVTDFRLEWTEATWRNNTSYGVGTLAVPTLPNGHVYRVTQGGITGPQPSSEPSWPTVSGQTIPDNGVIWQEHGATTVGPIPNAQQGFGRVNLEDLFKSYPHNVYENEARQISSPGTILSSEYKVHDGALPVTVVLAWTDPPGQIDEVAGTTNPLVNDLDLTVDLGSPCSAGIGRYVGNDPMAVLSEAHGEESPLRGCSEGTRDIVNNVEIVRFYAAAGVTFTVNVAGNNAVGLPYGPVNQKFALVIQNAYDSGAPAPPAAPTNLVAASSAPGQIALSWNAPTGQGITYEIRRKSGSAPLLTTICSELTSPSLVDTNLGPDVYVYEVRAKNATGVSDYSNRDVATTLTFTDDSLTAGETVVKKTHFDEARAAVNALRTAAALPAASFSTISSGITLIRASHINELRSALENAQDLLRLPRVQYTHHVLQPESSVISAVDVQELRNALK